MIVLTMVFMTAIGAMFGAFMRDEYLHRRKSSVELESKTPYDYALTNAINERDRLQDELITIQALKRTETDTERIRNEIDTILSDDGEGASEGAYEADNMRLEIEAAGKRWERNLRELFGDWEIPRIDKPTSDGRGHIPIQQHDDGTISPITWDNRVSSGEAAGNISKAFAKAYGTNVREDDIKDERLKEESEERSYLELIDKAIHSEQKVLCIYRNPAGEGLNGNDMAVGSIVNFRYSDGKTRYLTLRVRHTHKGGTHIMHISGEYLDEVSIMGGESHGEIIYRKESI